MWFEYEIGNVNFVYGLMDLFVYVMVVGVENILGSVGIMYVVLIFVGF